MAWTIKFDPRGLRDIERLDGSVRGKVIEYLETRVALADDAQDLGKALTGPLAGLWRYRVRDHRIVCRIQKQEIVVLVIAVGHRKDIYDRVL